MNFKKAAAKAGALVLAAAMTLTGCSVAKSNQTLIDIGKGKDKITLGYGNFVAKYYEGMYYIAYGSYFGGSSMWGQSAGSDSGKSMEDDVKDNVIEEIENSYLCKEHADEYNVTITDEEKQKIEDAADKFMKNDDSALKALGAKKEYVVDYLTYKTYSTRVENAFKDALTVEVPAADHQQASFTYVKFSTKDSTDASTGSTTTLTDADKTKLKADAETLSATPAADFETETETLGQNHYTETFDWAGTDFSSNTLPEDVYKTAQTLSDGQVSSVIEVDDEGYYVIRLDKQNDEEATQKKVTSLENDEKNSQYEDKLKEWKEDIGGMELNEKLWAKVKFDDTFTATSLDPAETTDATASGSEDATTDASGSADTTESGADENSGSADATASGSAE